MKFRIFFLVIVSVVLILSVLSCSEETTSNPFVAANSSTDVDRSIKCTADITPNPDPLQGCGSLTVNLTCNVNHSLSVQSYYWEKADYCNAVIQTWTTTTNTLTDTIGHTYAYCGRGVYHYRCTATFIDSSTITTNWVDAAVPSVKPVNVVKISQSYTEDQISNDYEDGIRPNLVLRMNRNITIDLSASIPDCDQTSIRKYSYEWYGNDNGAFEDPDYEYGTEQDSPIFTFRKVSNNHGFISLLVRTRSWDGGLSEFFFWNVQR